MRVLLLTTDAYGGHGGIALYNRDLADALASLPEVESVVVLARTLPFAPEGIPPKVEFIAAAAGGKARYVAAALRAATGGFDLVVCGHVNLLPLARMLNRKLRARLVLLAYGIEVWEAPSTAKRNAVAQLDAVWAISAVTRERMNGWAGLAAAKYQLLPNAIHLDRFGPGPKPAGLARRLGVDGGRVLLTLARLSAAERYKGVDEVLQALPGLLHREPTLKYVIAGSGDDRPRLERKAQALGIAGSVVFAGFVPEAEKGDYFRLADAFAMPGRGEGFGFVFLEALACGVPVVGSCLDGSRDALRDGELGALVDPTDPGSVSQGLLEALARPRGIPPGLAHFAWPRFRDRLATAVQLLNLPG